MSQVYLGESWQVAVQRDAPLLPKQFDALLKAYKTATRTVGIKPDDSGLPGYLQENTGMGRAYVSMFLKSMKKLASAGIVPYAEYDPSKSLMSQLVKGAGEVTKVGQGALTKVAIIAGIGLVGYLFISGQIRLPKQPTRIDEQGRPRYAQKRVGRR